MSAHTRAMTPVPADGPADGAPEALRDQRIAWTRPMVSPALLRDELPVDERQAKVVLEGRRATAAVLRGEDDRLLVVVGPCSVHDPGAALDYAERLAPLADDLADALCVVMRVYFEKPRTTLGWKGLINDPGLDGSFRVNDGLRAARRLVIDILELGLPVGCEFLDPIIPQYLADTVSWGAIGARTAESQVHRQLASGLSMPVGIKNSTGGDVRAAIDGVRAAAAGHVFSGVTDDGVAAIVATTGNADCHVVLRGGRGSPNFDPASVAAARTLLVEAGLTPNLMVDASHANSGGDHTRQPAVAADLTARLAAGEPGVVGVMLESFLVGGRQDVDLGATADLTYGQSITDACMGWDTTTEVLTGLAGAVERRRAAPEDGRRR